MIEKLLNEIIPLDIDLLQKYVDRTMKAGEKVKNKNGIVFIG